jgi:hypothetical protein
VRDLLRISGEVELTKGGDVRTVRLNAQAPRAKKVAAAFDEDFRHMGIETRVSTT